VDAIDDRYGEHHWVHVLGNTALAVAALDYGQCDRSRSICLVVSGGLDTDSNGATVGSLVGATVGADALPARWIQPLRNRVASTLTGFDGIGFDVLARRTVAVTVLAGAALPVGNVLGPVVIKRNFTTRARPGERSVHGVPDRWSCGRRGRGW
jgi:hypothetical protein